MIFTIVVSVFLVLLGVVVVLNRAFSPVLKTLLLVIFAVGMYLAHNTHQLDQIALFLGLDAGSDLVFYMVTMLVIYAVLVINHKIMLLNRKIEKLNRHLSIAGAVKPK